VPRDKSLSELSETNNPNAIPNLMMVGEMPSRTPALRQQNTGGTHLLKVLNFMGRSGFAPSNLYL
jgi:hypothetical protein